MRVHPNPHDGVARSDESDGGHGGGGRQHIVRRHAERSGPHAPNVATEVSDVVALRSERLSLRSHCRRRERERDPNAEAARELMHASARSKSQTQQQQQG